ncbi:4-phosphoerythronate dehydrogenase [Marinomonas ostreistagni]|uniref:4-phosphoerythronate dehydrogenase n=1 Tax=Marinomonas ostreistagni TaxID=359209 RepID=UPI00194EA253|nr:4-phosphoerythronate dehydrogenase [Marinomonas ostreistagni]MBM6550295.1 4-phosphoerythronate dehydrogenase [Marinomonas ostreistagni]
MKIIADENMPNVAPLFGGLGEVTLVSGRDLTRAQLEGADVLLVRSVTKVNEALLEGTSIKYVGSATIGTDHVDTNYLLEAGIGFNSAPGCNADAVADYVFSSLAHLYLHKGVEWLGRKIGIVGQGNVGRCVAARFVALGCEVLAYDPLVNSTIEGVHLSELDEVLKCDIVSLHAPLTRTGLFPSYDMIDAERVANLKAGQTIISAGRGGVINEPALIAQYEALNGELNLVLDVWDNEPHPNMALAALCDIATPHIAGYSKQGREKGTWFIYQSLCQFFDISEKSSFAEAVSGGSICEIKMNATLTQAEVMSRAMHAIYDVARDSARFMAVMQDKTPRTFDWLRKNYVERDEFNTCVVHHDTFLYELNAIGFAKHD